MAGTMVRKLFLSSKLWQLIMALVLALCLLPASASPVAALNLSEYFSVSYTVQFSKAAVVGSESFSATATIEATCTKDLPAPYSLASQVSVTGRIVADHQASGARVTLNPGYKVTLGSFPRKAGEHDKVVQPVPLQFPAGSQSGTYEVIAVLDKAEVKVLLAWIEVTDSIPAAQRSQTAGSVTYTSTASGGGGGSPGGGGGGAEEVSSPALPPGTTDVSGKVSAEGVFTEAVVAPSGDGKCKLNIGEGIRGLDREGNPLNQITVTGMVDYPAPPKNHDTVGLTYNLGPEGVTFDPPIALTITYDDSLLPDGADEENLVMATWDAVAGEWVVLIGSTVDPEANTITAPVSHFTPFTILAYTGSADFVASELSISPAEVEAGEEVTVHILIKNIGDLGGSYKVNLRIDNVVTASREVTLEGGTAEKVDFTVTEDVAGTYTVSISGLSGTFVVKGPAAFTVGELLIAPAEVGIGEEVTISAFVTNIGDVTGSYKVTLRINDAVVTTKKVTLEGSSGERVAFTVTRKTAGTYTASIEGLSGTFVVRVPPEPAAPQRPIGAIIAGVIVVVVVAVLLTVFLRRRRA